MAKKTIDARGGTEQLKRDAERLKGIATGPGTAKEKAKAGSEALKQPNGPGGSTRPAGSPTPPSTPRASTEQERREAERPRS